MRNETQRSQTFTYLTTACTGRTSDRHDSFRFCSAIVLIVIHRQFELLRD
ncbi:hypothetical protein [Pleurocapsa sp. PCC 7327]|nr:hypothetical protein [Pleurocapsa sp. PCC 7327]